MNPSCLSCPSFLTKEEATKVFNKDIGTPVCARYGKALDSPAFTQPSQTKKLQEHLASKCDSHGKSTPIRPLTFEFDVAMPDLGYIAEVQKDAKDGSAAVPADMISTCAQCAFFVRDDIVAEETGWQTGMCSAKGKLILPNRRSIEAKGCVFKSFGSRSTLGEVHALPEYDAKFGLHDPIKEYFEVKEEFVDPSEYETDRPVSPRAQASGIRAWRKVVEPGGSKFSFLPIYDKDFFDPKDRALVPNSGDEEHPELYVDHFGGVYLAAITWNELDETPALWGEPGTGKTELFRHLAWLMQLPFRRISITGSTELDDLAGKMMFTPEMGTHFQYGRLPNAWSKPGVICIDEPNVGPPDVWQFLRPLTDNSKQLILDQNAGESLPRHNDCYMGMAMNQAWDAKNIGAMQISEADANRLFHVNLPLPPRKLEEEIIEERVKLDGWEISQAELKTLMDIASDIRDLIEEGTLQISWALRPQIKVARAMRWFEPVVAYRRAIADYLEPEVSEVLLNIVRSHTSNN